TMGASNSAGNTTASESVVALTEIKKKLLFLFDAAIEEKWTAHLVAAAKMLICADSHQLQQPSSDCVAEIALQLATVQKKLPKELREAILKLSIKERKELMTFGWLEREAKERIDANKGDEQESQRPSAEELLELINLAAAAGLIPTELRRLITSVLEQHQDNFDAKGAENDKDTVAKYGKTVIKQDRMFDAEVVGDEEEMDNALVLKRKDERVRMKIFEALRKYMPPHKANTFMKHMLPAQTQYDLQYDITLLYPAWVAFVESMGMTEETQRQLQLLQQQPQQSPVYTEIAAQLYRTFRKDSAKVLKRMEKVTTEDNASCLMWDLLEQIDNKEKATKAKDLASNDQASYEHESVLLAALLFASVAAMHHFITEQLYFLLFLSFIICSRS
ncbi:hypothetical protein PENTCL1PPCAC_7745, partial [Pristionchus entomophagus]